MFQLALDKLNFLKSCPRLLSSVIFLMFWQGVAYVVGSIPDTPWPSLIVRDVAWAQPSWLKVMGLVTPFVWALVLFPPLGWQRILHITWIKLFLILGAGTVAGTLTIVPETPVYALSTFVASWGVLLYFTLENKRAWKAGFYGFIWGIGYFTLPMAWIGQSLMVEADRWAWLWPVCVIGIPALLALLSPAFVLALTVFWVSSYGWRCVLFPCMWLSSELLRSYVFPCFPWHLAGQVWHGNLTFVQGASVVGVYGLSLAALVLVCLVMGAIKKLTHGHHRQAVYLFLGCLAFLKGWSFLGHQRIQGALNRTSGMVWRVVQPCVLQHIKIDPRYRAWRAQRLIEMTFSHLPAQVTHILWPESAWPYPMKGDKLPENLRPDLLGKAVLVSGVIRYEENPLKIWNSILFFSPRGSMDVYDKQRLVPFGEYLPLRKLFQLFPGIDKIVPGAIDFSHGVPHKRLNKRATLPGFTPWVAFVCYESIFSKLFRDQEEHPPAVLVNVTNDGWFGHTWGPYQHLILARFRALEEGAPLVRAANTGISAVIDPYGRWVQGLALGQQGVMDIPLPAPLENRTLYSQYSTWIFLNFLIVFFVLAAVGRFFTFKKELPVT